MFNGIIYNQGSIKKITKRKNGVEISINSNLKISTKDIGMSISCDGVCLTLIDYNNKSMKFYLSNETLKKSNFENIKVGKNLNLELPLKFGKQISGLITMYGGANSHMAIRAAEFGLPAAIGVGEKQYNKLVNSSLIELSPEQLTIKIIR